MTQNKPSFFPSKNIEEVFIVMRKGENIYKRKDGRWEGRYIKGKKESGKTQYGYVYGHSLQEVREKLYPMKIRYFNVLKMNGLSCMSVFEWGTRWLAEIQMDVKPSTYASYYHKLTKYVFPLLGKQSLNELSQESGNRFVQELQEHSLKPSSIHVIFQVVNRMLNHAKNVGRLKFNPFSSVRLPKIKQEKIKALSVRQQRALEKVVLTEQDQKGMPVMVSLYTGLRIGEISALKWKDIDFEQNVIHVEHTCQRIPLINGKKKTKLIFDSTKTIASTRIVPLGKRLKKLLLQYKISNDSNNVFVFSKNNTPTEPRLITYHFHKIREKAGLPMIHFHQLRHTFATRCLESHGDISTVSALLGHTSTQMTLDVYSDSLLEQRFRVIQLLEKQLHKKI